MKSFVENQNMPSPEPRKQQAMHDSTWLAPESLPRWREQALDPKDES